MECQLWMAKVRVLLVGDYVSFQWKLTYHARTANAH